MSVMPELSRRGFLGAVGAGALSGLGTQPTHTHASDVSPIRTGVPQRICVVMFDGFGSDYYENSPMPTLKSWERNGFYKRIQGVMPSVTNTNMAGICCGVHANEHGITGNSYWDADTDQELFMSDGNLLTAATMFQRAGRFGVRSILVAAKQKTIPLLRQGTSLAIGSQDPPREILDKYGKPPEIYSPDVNYWVWKVAIDIAPDHGLNSKSTVLNLNKTLARKDVAFKIAMSAERDQYPKHHGGFGGTAFVYLKSPADSDSVIRALRDVDGIEELLTREEAARKYMLNPHRIGDLWLTAVKDVVFGHSQEEREQLAHDYRSHGSAHELDIPGFIYRYAGNLPDPSEVSTNLDLCKFLYRAG